MPIRNRIVELHGEIVEWRRHLHENPELLYETHRTAAFVARKLREFGCDDVVEGIGRTGVVGLLHGRRGASGRVVGLRADMDALPILEETGLPYASKVPGVMHACGHDGHTAMLLGAARYLADTRNFEGSVAFIFQPAEEGGAGAQAMIDDGLMTRFGIDEVYGMHNMPAQPVGAFSIRAGAFYAASDSFRIDVAGLGGHGARPELAVDTTLVAAQITVSLQSIVSRNVDPQEAVVLSVTSFRTATNAYNVIPSSVELRGTLRTFSATTRTHVMARMAAIAAQCAGMFDARAEIHWLESAYPVMANSAAETQHAIDAARSVSKDVETHTPANTGAEDFAFMLRACPGAYIQLGNGDTPFVHHPKYDFNDEAIPAGTSYWIELVERRLPVSQ